MSSLELSQERTLNPPLENTYKELWPNSNEALRPNQIKLKTYTRQQIQVRESMVVKVQQYGDQLRNYRW